ncbi:Ras GTPase activating protein ira2 [Blyttiomyces sp. JEL0837]|nr:Ras GTPase activating protein ira2 [Blyttiomyces sp. JEL0837]
MSIPNVASPTASNMSVNTNNSITGSGSTAAASEIPSPSKPSSIRTTGSARSLSTHTSSNEDPISANPASAGMNPPLPTTSTNTNTSSSTSNSTSTATTAAVRMLSDPPPLDEGLARYILNALVPFFYTHAGQINPDTISHIFYSQSLIGYNDDREAQIASFYMQSKTDSYMPSADLYIVPLGGDIFPEMQKVAGRIVFYVSASNWPLMFGRVRGRLQYLVSDAGQTDSDDFGNADVTEIRFLEWCNLNRLRLGTIVAEFNICIKSFAKRVQYLTAIALRRCIWNWIETHPTEFGLLCQSQKRLDGSPEALFLAFNSLADNIANTSRRRTLFWPTQAMLTLLSPDILASVISGKLPPGSSSSNTNTISKVQNWFDNVKKSLRSKLGEVSTLCLVDLCRASAFVGKLEGGFLRVLGPSLEVELKDKLFASVISRGFAPNHNSSNDESSTVDHGIITDCLTTFYKLNPWNTLRTLISSMLDPQVPSMYKVILVRFCFEIVNEENPLPWNPTIDASLAAPLRALFMENVYKEKTSEIRHRKGPFIGNAEKKARKAMAEEASERYDMVFGILKIWCKCPLLAIARDTSVIGLDELRSLFQSILACLNDAASEVRLCAAEAIHTLFDPDFVRYWDGSVSDWRVAAHSPINQTTGLPATISAAPSESSMLLYWKVSCHTVNVLARQLLDLRLEVPAPELGVGYGFMISLVKAGLELLREILRLRNLHLRRCPEVASLGVNLSDRVLASSALETSLLVMICCPDTEIVTLVIKCIGLIVDEIDITTGNIGGGPGQLFSIEGDTAAVIGATPAELNARNPGSYSGQTGSEVGVPVMSFMTNIEVYRELKSLYSGGGIVAGQKALQKKLRKILRKMDNITTGAVGAWEEVYRRWKFLCSAILAKSAIGRSQRTPGQPEPVDISDDKGDRQNYTGFLCSLGMMSLKANPARLAGRQGGYPYEDIPVEAMSIGAGGMPKNLGQRFVTEMVSMMVCDNVVIREYVKDYLGNELSSTLFDPLFTYCESIVGRFLTPEGIGNLERNVFFVESFMSVLKMILERADDDSIGEDEFLAMTGAVDFGSLILTFINYLGKIHVHPGHLAHILRIKIKTCQLIEVVVLKKDIIALRQDIRFRNRVLDIILDWNAEYASIAQGGDEANVDQKNKKLSRDLEIAGMKALVAILHGLPLQPTSEAMQRMSTDDNTSLDDIDEYMDSTNELKSKLFYRYLSFFLKILQRCKVMEAVETKTLDSINTSSAESQLLMTRSKETLQHIGPLKEFAILSLSNLLSANIDIGLKYSLSMGYHEDSKTRASFMQVLTNLLESGAKEQFEGLGEEGQRLVEIITDKDLTIALALCDVSDVEDVAGILMSIFESRGEALRLVSAVIEHEVAKTDYASNLFRRNSMATRLFSAFAKSCGQEFLVAALKPVLEEILSIQPTLTFEIDPVRLQEHDDPAINLKNLKMLVKRLLDHIVGAQNMLPQPLREACHQLAEIVDKRFPDSRVQSVGGFIFLRFICPVIVAPETFNIVPPIESRDIRRGLVLATKVIQNLSNNVLFGAKESYMTDLNDLLRRNIGRVHGFLRFISDKTADNPPEPALEQPNIRPNLSEYDLMRLHRVLALNLDKIENANLSLTIGFGRSAETSERANSRKAMFASLSTLVAQLGPAPDATRLRLALISKERSRARGFSLPTDVTQVYQDFVQRVQNRSGIEKALEVLKERGVFYEEGVSKDGRPVVYYIARRVHPDSIDMELLLYHLLRVLKTATSKRVEIILDVTHFSVDNEWDLEWVRRFEELLPISILQNIASVIIYNCNSSFRKFAASCARVMETEAIQKFIFVSNLEELWNFIHPQQLRLPKSTINAEKDIIAVFSPVSRVNNQREYVPVIVKVAVDSIHVISVSKYRVLGVETVVNDIYRFADMEDVIPGGDNNEFLIKYAEKVSGVYGAGSTGNIMLSTMVFSSPKRDVIIRDIRLAKSQYKRSRPSNIIADERNLRPGDVPGTLLNMAMLNLGSVDPNLRLASYNLLFALSSNFDFRVGNKLFSAKGLCIPANNQGFVVNISQHLAASEKHLTLEFLIECVLGFNKSSKDQKLFCLEYMTPWLPNLAIFSKTNAPSTEHVFVVPQLDEEPTNDILPQKLKSFLKLLIELTVKEVDLFHLVQSKIWTILGQVEELLPLVLDAFVQTSVENGLGSQHTEVLANTLITLASVNIHYVAGKLIFRLLRCVETDIFSIVDQPRWLEITILIRFMLMLSFNNLLDVKRYLPELCHVLTLISGLGRPLIRSSIHGIAVNVIHSLCTLPSVKEGTVATLKTILTDLSDPKVCQLYGVIGTGLLQHRSGGGWAPNTSNSAFVFSSEALAGDIQTSIAPMNLRSIVKEMANVVSTGAGDPELAADWKSRWLSMVVEKTFDLNEAIQPRTFIALGILSSEDCSVEVLFQTLSSLLGCLMTYDDNNSVSTVHSITICLVDLIQGLKRTEETFDILKSIFWIGVGLIQLMDSQIFVAAVRLIETVVLVLDEAGAFKEEGLGDTLQLARTQLDKAGIELDEILSIWFSADFSYAMAAHLIKGLQMNLTIRQPTMSLLKTLLCISGKNPPPRTPEIPDYVADHCVGFLVPLMPSHAESVKELFKMAGLADHLLEFEGYGIVDESEKYRQILERLTPFTDANRAVLLVTVMVAILEISESETEAAFIYGILAEATLESPETTSLVYETLLPRLNAILTRSQSPNLLRPAHAIYQTMMACAPQSAPSAPSLLSVNRRSSFGSIGSSHSASSAPNNANARRSMQPPTFGNNGLSTTLSSLHSNAISGNTTLLPMNMSINPANSMSAPVSPAMMTPTTPGSSNTAVGTPPALSATPTPYTVSALGTPPTMLSPQPQLQQQGNQYTPPGQPPGSFVLHFPPHPLTASKALIERLTEVGFAGLPFSGAFQAPPLSFLAAVGGSSAGVSGGTISTPGNGSPSMGTGGSGNGSVPPSVHKPIDEWKHAIAQRVAKVVESVVKRISAEKGMAPLLMSGNGGGLLPMAAVPSVNMNVSGMGMLSGSMMNVGGAGMAISYTMNGLASFQE